MSARLKLPSSSPDPTSSLRGSTAPRRATRLLGAVGPGAIVALALGLAGCRNSCQDLCQEMADFAEEECGKEFPKDQVKECMETYHNREIDEGDEAVCEDILPTLREEWTCEEIKPYFEGGGGGGGGTDTGS